MTTSAADAGCQRADPHALRAHTEDGSDCLWLTPLAYNVPGGDPGSCLWGADGSHLRISQTAYHRGHGHWLVWSATADRVCDGPGAGGYGGDRSMDQSNERSIDRAIVGFMQCVRDIQSCIHSLSCSVSHSFTHAVIHACLHSLIHPIATPGFADCSSHVGGPTASTELHCMCKPVLVQQSIGCTIG